MKTNIGDINNRFSQEQAKKAYENRMNSFWNIVIAFAVAFGIGLIISFLNQ